MERIEAENDTTNVLEKSKVKSNINDMNYTPVNAETFAIWCEKYKERMRVEREKNRKGWEDKPSGKEIFLASKKDFEDITLDDADDEEFKADDVDDEEEVEDFKYDRALYNADELTDEDVDFDD